MLHVSCPNCQDTLFEGQDIVAVLHQPWGLNMAYSPHITHACWSGLCA